MTTRQVFQLGPAKNGANSFGLAIASATAMALSRFDLFGLFARFNLDSDALLFEVGAISRGTRLMPIASSRAAQIASRTDVEVEVFGGGRACRGELRFEPFELHRQNGSAADYTALGRRGVVLAAEVADNGLEIASSARRTQADLWSIFPGSRRPFVIRGTLPRRHGLRRRTRARWRSGRGRTIARRGSGSAFPIIPSTSFRYPSVTRKG